jgi:dTDP-4-amino-4,6-dideoxygalactose transaminase
MRGGDGHGLHPGLLPRALPLATRRAFALNPRMASPSSVPFMDLGAQTAEVRAEIDAALRRIIDKSSFILGPDVAAFEGAWAAYCGVPHAIGCSNGTSALHVALHAAGIGPGDEVIVPSHTFFATPESVLQCGAMPVFADIEDDTMLLDPGSVLAAITPRTKAIVPVHIYGCPARMNALQSLADTHGLMLFEDAAQGHGARYYGQPVGSLAKAAAFSFFPAKNLGAFGDAGGVTTADPALAERARRFVNHGRIGKYEHQDVGTNYRLDTVQAAVLAAKLPRLDAWNGARRRLAARYIERLSAEPFASVPVRWQIAPEGAEPCWHLFVIRVPERDRVMAELKKRGIDTGIHYPIPCHRQPACAAWGYPAGSLPTTERVASEIISLPMYPHMPESHVDRVCEALAECLPTGVTR